MTAMRARQPNPKTPLVRERGEVVTPHQRAQPPRPTDTSWWLALTALLALLLAAHTLWSLA